MRRIPQSQRRVLEALRIIEGFQSMTSAMSSGSGSGPTVYVLAGPNGAGKTTFAMRFLREIVHCREFLNADMIAAGLSPFAPETQALRAGRLLLTRMKELSDGRCDFGFETTLAGKGYINKLIRMKRSGYRVILYFLWLPSADIAVARVANRVRQGGHDIPEAVIRRRYESGLRNFFQFYAPLADAWGLFYANTLKPKLIASQTDGTMTVNQPERFETIVLAWSS